MITKQVLEKTLKGIIYRRRRNTVTNTRAQEIINFGWGINKWEDERINLAQLSKPAKSKEEQRKKKRANSTQISEENPQQNYREYKTPFKNNHNWKWS